MQRITSYAKESYGPLSATIALGGILTLHVPAIIVCYNGLFVLGKLVYYTSGGYVFFIGFGVCLEFGIE